MYHMYIYIYMYIYVDPLGGPEPPRQLPAGAQGEPHVQRYLPWDVWSIVVIV